MDRAVDPLVDIAARLRAGQLIPYLGPAALALDGAPPVPATPEVLVTLLTKRVAVPLRVRKELSAAAQYIENFKHRKTLRAALLEFFAAPPAPNALHRLLASEPAIALVVDAWYDDALAAAYAGRTDWGQIHAVSRAEHRDQWTQCFDGTGATVPETDVANWRTLLYKPFGCVRPGGNFLVSDSDFVEVLTEIDIQTPIPARVQSLRGGRGFLFLGCRFDGQIARSFARQIVKRSGGDHRWVFDGNPTRNESKFAEEVGIDIVPLALPEFVTRLAQALAAPAAPLAASTPPPPGLRGRAFSAD